jgi:hypothetical protein
LVAREALILRMDGMLCRYGALLLLFAVIIMLSCVSCVGTGVSKSARVDPGVTGSTALDAAGDKGIADTWELLYQVNEKGDEERPKEATRTLIEFTKTGQVIFNRIDNENSDRVKSRTGKYSIDRAEINITDDAGNTVKWPYQVTGDTLVISMPEVKKKFHWRRFR